MSTPTTLASIRAAFATAIESAGYKAYAQPLATVTPPGVVIVPGEPYLEANTLASGGIVWQLNLTLIVVVAYLDNQAALRNIEDIIVKVCAKLPRGTVFDIVQQPTVEEVGPSSLLTCRIPVSIRANLTAPA
jgi:hypothetical protein